MKPKPSADETTVAEVIAAYFKSDVQFVMRSSITTPDILVGDIAWEIKHPRGNTKHTVRNNLRTAKTQSKFVILGLSRTNLLPQQVEGRVKEFFRDKPTPIKTVLIVTKSGKVLEINK